MTTQTLVKEISLTTQIEGEGLNLTKVYHIAYEPSFKTATLHF